MFVDKIIFINRNEEEKINLFIVIIEPIKKLFYNDSSFIQHILYLYFEGLMIYI